MILIPAVEKHLDDLPACNTGDRHHDLNQRAVLRKVYVKRFKARNPKIYEEIVRGTTCDAHSRDPESEPEAVNISTNWSPI